MRRDAQAVLLLLVGGTLLKISFAGTYVRYVKPGLLPLLLIAGAVLVTVAVVTLWHVVAGHGTALANPVAHPAPAPAGGAGGTDGGHGHNGDAQDGHGHGEPRVGWLLLVPALALLLFAPPAVGSFQASRNGTALSSQAESDFAPLPDGDPARISVLDYASRAVFDQGRSIGDRRVALSGFVIPGPNGESYLARMIVTCCAADARPIKVGLSGEVPTDLAPEQWIEVVGTFTDHADRDAVNGETIPYLQVTSSRLIPAPNQQYES
jgi:uncharacterized repeat protein (TIGR03943 family)